MKRINVGRADICDIPLWLDACGSILTTYAVKQWHYSQRLPLGVKRSYAVWEYGQYIGAIVYAIPAGRMIATFFGVEPSEVIELSRVALTNHAANVSKIIAASLRLLRAETDYRLVVSYADPYHGHVGGIYQAGGWTYTGEGTKHKAYLDHDGRLIHDRNVSPKGHNVNFGVRSQCLRPCDMAEVIDLPRKHRYAMAIDKGLVDRIKGMAQPYPKRARNVDSGIPSNHGGRGGALPTLAHDCDLPSAPV